VIELWFIPFVIVAILAISALVFGGWVAMMTFKGVAWMIGAIFLGPLLVWRNSAQMGGACPQCGQVNPRQARYCRRCGYSVRQA